MSPKKITLPVDIYVRVSDVRGRSGDSFISPEDQQERCRALAKARGYQVGEVFKDMDVSGAKMRRPALDKAIARIEDGSSGGILVAKLDRFARTLVEGLQTLERIDQLGGAVVIADGEFDTSTATGEMVLRIMLTLAAFELRRIKETWASSKRHAVEHGIHITRHTPPGYVRGEDRRLAPDGAQAEAVREAFQMAANGDTYAAIADYLTKRGLLSGGNAIVWQPNRIKRLLENRVYLGEARNGHGDVNVNAHKPLVTELVWNMAQRTSTRPNLTVSVENLLSGLCRCANCSFAMKSQAARGATVGTYRCSTSTTHGRCEHPSSISMLRVEDYVVDQFLARVATVSLQPRDDEDDDAAGRAAVEAEHSYREALTNLDLRKSLGAADHSQLVAVLKQEWEEAIAAVPVPTRPLGGDSTNIAALVEELRRREDVVSLRELLASAIQAVFVRPAASRARNLPIEDRVRIVWSDEPQLALPRRGERFEPRPYEW